MWGMDHGTDWLGNDIPPEELNRLEEGQHYGWPYVYGDRQLNPSQVKPGDGKAGEILAKAKAPVLGYQAHSAPMMMVFYTADAFPKGYHHDAFVAMRGSWNRKPPTGYKIVRLRFEGGEPQGFEDFVTGFLIEGGDAFLARLAGLAVAGDGSLLASDDTNGVIYRIAFTGEDKTAARQ
ncbi:MAG: hypothetical protein AMXMBFR13_22760 [Phycisphaerae bacterium]